MDLVEINLDPFIEEDHRCFVLGGYFMAALLAAASYSRIVSVFTLPYVYGV